MNAENKAGIQIMKKIVDNIPVNSRLYERKKSSLNFIVLILEIHLINLLMNLIFLETIMVTFF